MSRAVLACALVVPLLGADWPQFLGPNRDGHSRETGLLTAWPKGGPAVVWECEVGEGFSSPVVADGKLILFHRVGTEEVIECFDAKSGKRKWKHGYTTRYKDSYGKGDGPRSTPVISGGRVYSLGAEGQLTCVELDSGKHVWTRSLHKDYTVPKSFFGVGTSPLIDGDLVLINVGGENAGIVALNKDTGKEVWKATDQGASYSSPVAAEIEGVRHVLFFTREGLVSLDPVNGKVRFQKRWRSRNDASVNASVPLVIGDQIFLTASYNTGAVLLKAKKDSVDEVWKSDRVLSCHFGTPVHVAGFLYGFDGRQEGGTELRCVELKTGDVKWKQEGFGCGSILAVQDMLLILSEGGELVLAEASAAGYKEKARAAVLRGPCRASPALSNGLLFARDDKKLVCWNLKK